jgi:hypothetical protein
MMVNEQSVNEKSPKNEKETSGGTEGSSRTPLAPVASIGIPNTTMRRIQRNELQFRKQEAVRTNELPLPGLT